MDMDVYPLEPTTSIGLLLGPTSTGRHLGTGEQSDQRCETKQKMPKPHPGTKFRDLVEPLAHVLPPRERNQNWVIRYYSATG